MVYWSLPVTHTIHRQITECFEQYWNGVLVTASDTHNTQTDNKSTLSKYWNDVLVTASDTITDQTNLGTGTKV